MRNRSFQSGGATAALLSREPQRVTDTKFCWRVATAAAISIGLVVLSLLIGWLAPVLLIAFAGTLVAVLLRALAGPLSRWLRLNDILSTLLAATLVLALVATIGWIGGASIIDQSRELSQGLSRALSTVEERIGDHAFGRFVMDNLPFMNDSEQRLWLRLEDASRMAFTGVAALLLSFAVGLFFAVRPTLYKHGLLRLLPISRRRRGAEVVFSLHQALRGWLLGQGISMLFLFLATWVLLTALGVPLAFILAVLTGTLTFVPYLGPLIALLPIALVALAESPTLALWTIAGFLVIQALEGNLVTPLILQRTVSLPPALTVMAQVIMGGLLGLGGILLATPLLVVTIVLVQRVYIEGVLGDSLERKFNADDS